MFLFLLALLIAALTGWLVETVASGTIERAISAFRELIGGWRPDPWPRGVQEEDRDRPWGSVAMDTIRSLIEPAAHPVATAQVRGKTRPR
jgi:hypothetical protein